MVGWDEIKISCSRVTYRCSTGEFEVGRGTLSETQGGVQLRREEQNLTLPVPRLYLTMLSVPVASSVPMLI